MRIQVKTLKSARYYLEIKDDDAVLDIKVRIQKKLQLGIAEMMNLIHHGKILQNEQLVSDIGFRENDFIVLMLKKNRKKSSGSSSQTSHTPTIPKGSTPLQASPVPPSDVPTRDSSSAWSVVEPTTTEEVNIDGIGNEARGLDIRNQSNEVTAGLVAMGFSERDVGLAMDAAFNNPEIAVDYLLAGIPQQVFFQREFPGTGATMSDGTDSHELATGAPSAISVPSDINALTASAEDLTWFLAHNPEAITDLFQGLITQQPEMYRRLTGPDGQLNPETFHAAIQDPDFIIMLRETLLRAGDDEPSIEINQDEMFLRTPDDEIVVERLQQMGFSRNHVLEAYVVCNKNEQMAANYLFDNAVEFSSLPLMNPAQQSRQELDINAPVPSPIVERPPAREIRDRNSANVEDFESTETENNSNTSNEQE